MPLGSDRRSASGPRAAVGGVLLVDAHDAPSESPLRGRVHDALLEAGHRVRCARGVTAAIDAMRADRPRVCLLDLGGARLDGAQLRSAQLADASICDIPVIGLFAEPPSTLDDAVPVFSSSLDLGDLLRIVGAFCVDESASGASEGEGGR